MDYLRKYVARPKTKAKYRSLAGVKRAANNIFTAIKQFRRRKQGKMSFIDRMILDLKLKKRKVKR